MFLFLIKNLVSSNIKIFSSEIIFSEDGERFMWGKKILLNKLLFLKAAYGLFFLFIALPEMSEVIHRFPDKSTNLIKGLKENLYKIGNMTLLHSTDNRELSNKNIQEKSSLYKDDAELKITRKVAEDDGVINKKWTAESINNLTSIYAKLACEEWKLDCPVNDTEAEET